MSIKGDITKASDFVNLKTRIKNEMNRRNGYGSLTTYGTATYDFTVVPAAGNKPLIEHYTKTRDLMTNINSAKVGQGIKTSGSNIEALSVLEANMTNFEAQPRNATSGNDCAANCSGMCVTTCSTGCLGCTGCTGSCTGGCTSCTGSCTGGCNGCTGSCTSCSGTCVGGCTGCTNCTGGCSGCTSGCTGGCTGCQGTCLANCASTCDIYCGSGCTGTCTSCVGGCTADCLDGDW